jgi:glycosyltransferase involved in cell wall biosynthesis
MDQTLNHKIRVLFFAWGDSIHARRRIQIFTEDPEFTVGVVSTFAYNFQNATNFPLAATGLIKDKLTEVPLAWKIVRAILIRILYVLFRCFDRKTTLGDCYEWFLDVQLTRDYGKQFKPDVIFLHTLMYPCYLSFLLPRRFPIIITFWNGDVIWWAKWNGIERLLKKKIITYGVKRAKSLTVNSKMAYDECLRYGVDKKKVNLIRYPGVDLRLFKKMDKWEARNHVGIDKDNLVVFCPRGASAYLNNDIIVESAKYVVERYSSVTFYFISITSAEPELARLRQRAKELGIENNFRWDGKVPWEKMPYYYNAADVTVSISSKDSLPNCMLESMACGTPIILGDIPQIREWVTDGENGYLVPTRDPIALSDKILNVLTNNKNINELFSKINIELVSSVASMEINIDEIKRLTKDVSNNSIL